MSVAATLVLAALGLAVLAGGLLYGESIASLFASQVSGSGKADHYRAPGERTAHPGPGRRTTAVEGIPEDEVLFPRQRRPVGVGPAAGAVGKLVLDDDGCIRLKPSPKDPGYIPIWPAEFELEVAGGEIRILDGKGQVVAKVGEEVDLMGGEAGSSLEGFDIVDKRTKRELYERCRLRDYWFVSPDTLRAGP